MRLYIWIFCVLSVGEQLPLFWGVKWRGWAWPLKLFKTGCVKTPRPPLKRALERLPRFWTASLTLTSVYWKAGWKSRRGRNPTTPQRKWGFSGDTGLRKKRKKREFREWQLVENKMKKKKEKEKEIQEKKCVLKSQGNTKTPKRSTPARSGDAIKVSTRKMKAEGRSWGPVYPEDQKGGSPSSPQKGGWRFSLPKGARLGGQGEVKRLRHSLVEVPRN